MMAVFVAIQWLLLLVVFHQDDFSAERGHSDFFSFLLMEELQAEHPGRKVLHKIDVRLN